MTTENETTWLYYKLCIGARMDGMDFLIRGVIAEAALDPRVLQWFYIRYFDQDGPHLRVRLKVPASEAKLADRDFHTRFHDGTTALTTLLPSESRPLITVPDAETAIPRGTFPARARRATYEPEHEIYGGPAGVAIAESVFQVSSEIAIAVLGDGTGAGHDRKDVAPLLMLAALDEFIAKDAQPAFLETYVNHWLAASPGLGYLKTLFHERALELLDDGEQILVPEGVLPEVSVHALHEWRRSLADAHARYRKSKELNTPALLERVCFYFLHLMNNRLGFTALEEAYLSVLLLNTRRARGDVQEPA
jgi:thiopeptide-type bacteriocin biosynthesis protein